MKGGAAMPPPGNLNLPGSTDSTFLFHFYYLYNSTVYLKCHQDHQDQDHK